MSRQVGNSTEEPNDLLPEHLKVNGKGLPAKLFLLRQKLYLKAKREPGFRFYTLYEAVLTCRGTFDDLARLNIQLTEGLQSTFYTDDADEMGNSDDLEADGHAHFDVERNHWIAVIDWDTLRHASDGRSKPKEL